MSNNNAASHPYAHLIGAPVVIPQEVAEELEIDWSDGIIVCALSTPRGVGIHVANPETGQVTLAVDISAVTLHENTLKLLTMTGEMNVNAMAQLAQILAKGDWD